MASATRRGRRWLAAAWCLLLLTGALGAQAPSGNGTTAERVLIRVRSSATPALMAAGAPLLSSAEADRVAARLQRDYGAASHGRALRFAMLFATVDSSRLGALRADPAVLSVEPDVLTYLSDVGPSVPVAAMGDRVRAPADAIPWGVERVGAPAAWAASHTGTGIKVGIIDSGIDPSQPDLQVAGGYDFTTGSASSSAWADNVAACNGHGTHVAGIVAARQNGSGIIGVAPEAQLYALKVFEPVILPNDTIPCAAWTSNQIAAIDWAVAHGIRVLNISIASSTALQAYQDAVTNAFNADVLVVAAAGNNSGGSITYPAAYDHAVAVGALTASNAVAYFSSLGSQMWVAAPGASILSTLPGGGTGSLSGTSMAAPHVTGVAALLLSGHPGWTASQLRDALRDGAQDLSSPGWDSGTGWGLVQADTGSAGGGGGGGGGGGSPALAVSPSSRRVAITQGDLAPAAQATVTLSGTNASTTGWSATKRKSWTALLTSSGTGSGSVSWARNALGLAPGTYVDTITVAASGATGSPAYVIDSLVVTAAPVPATMAVAPGSRSASVVEGGAAPPDSATITMSGTNAWSVGWTATARHSWTQLTTVSGSGSGRVRWNRDAGGLAAGTHVDTITVTAAATGSPARIIDTLIVTAAPAALTLAVSPRSRHATVVQGGHPAGDQAYISLTGAGATATSWSVTHSSSWLTLINAGGTGSATLRWSRNAAGLAPGVHVDTIRVNAGGALGSPAMVIDTLEVTVPTVSVTLAIVPGSRSASGELYGSAPPDSAAIMLTGADAATASWTASHSAGWVALATTEGTGNGTLRWGRQVAGLAPGLYVDTITVTIPGASGSPAFLIDTLAVSGVTPLALTVTPASRRTDAVVGTSSQSDQASVQLTGTGAGTTSWYATARKAWTTLLTPNGTGPGTVQWQRQLGGLPPGTYVDTITVAAGPLSATILDSLVVASDGKGGTIVIARTGSRRRQLRMDGQQTSVGSDSVQVQGVGGWAPSGGWTATTSSNWIHLASWSGSFPGMLRWSRSTGGLGNGVHVDSIVVQLVADPAFRGVYVDSVEVVSVTSPTATVAANALFQGGGLSGDQVAILDAGGNKNGRYDLGDFLAWVERGNIQLNGALMAKVQAAIRAESPVEGEPDRDGASRGSDRPDR